MRFVIVFTALLVLLAILPDGDAGDRPLIDSILWLRFVAAFAVVIWLPGFLLCGRHVSRHDPMSRFHIACAGGIVAVAFGAFLASLVRLPVTVQFHVPAVLLLALLLGRLESWRALFASVDDEPNPPGRALTFGVVITCVAVLSVQLAGACDFAAPPGSHDAVNHAFLAQRIAESASIRADAIFAEPWGQPLIPYVAGWHAVPALISQVAGVPTWIAVWFLPLVALALLPLAQATLWRQFRMPPLAIGVGVILLLGNRQIMRESIKFANFGQFVGMLLAPFIVLLICQARRHASVPAGALAGLAVGVLARVHVSWAVFALLLAAVALWCRRKEWTVGARRPVLLTGAAVALLVCAVELLPALSDYQSRAMAPHPTIPPADALRRLLIFLGRSPVAIGLCITGIAVGLLRSGTRPVAVLSLALGVLTVGLAVGRDPVSPWLSGFVYRQYSRLLVPQIFLLPVLAGAALALVCAALRRFVPPRVAAAFLLVPALWAAAVGCSRLRLGNLANQTLFDADDARLARRIAGHVPAGDRVANWRLDGSPWAMHRSGRRFLIPAGWILGWYDGLNPQRAIRGLVEKPWPAETRRLEAMSVHWLWVTDHHLPEHEAPDLRPELFAGDPRFTPALEGQHSTLYRIDWQHGIALSPRVEP